MLRGLASRVHCIPHRTQAAVRHRRFNGSLTPTGKHETSKKATLHRDAATRSARSAEASILNNERGVTSAHFRNIFQSPSNAEEKARRLRWDWHLRNLIYALITPAVAYVVLRTVDETLFKGSDNEAFIKSVTASVTDSVYKQKELAADAKITQEDLDGFDVMRRKLEQRIERLEVELEQLRGAESRRVDASAEGAEEEQRGGAGRRLLRDQTPVDRARRIASRMVRAAPPS